jgi:ribosomal protein S27AE
MTMTNYQTPTAETYEGLDKAFNHFNEHLFENRLPPVLFTLTRKGKANGYFWPEQFKHRTDGDTTHEIALNPNTMGRDLVDVLSTLVHEMTHLEQQEYGTPGKKGHHNREWVGLMERIGLIPSNTGEPGGKQTGRQMTHYIDPMGDFLTAFDKLMPFDLPYFTQPAEAGAKTKKKDLSKLKHTCPCCDAKAWAKQGMRIICGDCDETMIEEEV